MSLDEIIRKIHLYTGLQASIALLIFSITVLTLSTGHVEEPTVTHDKFVGDTNTKGLKLAISLYKQVGHQFEAVPKRWMVKVDEPGMLLVKFESPKGLRKIRLNKTNGDIEIRTWPSTFPQFINHMHQQSMGRRRLTDSLWLWAWSFYIELSVFALFTLPVTGLYIWVAGKSIKKHWAKLILVSSLITMVILWNLIR